MTQRSIDPGHYGEMVDYPVQGQVREKVSNPMEEIGDSGLKRSAGIIDEEFLPALRGTKAIKVYTEMSSNEAVIGALLFAIEKLVRQVSWNVVGANSTPEQQEAVEFVEQCRDDMSHSWGDFIAECLSMIPYGWSWHEIVYKKRIGPWESDPKKRSRFTDGKFGWRKFPIRGQETLFRWIFDDNGGVKAMVQMPPPTYTQRVVPIERSLLFRTGAHKGNPEGRSMLRTAYRSWFFKKRIEEFEAIGVERDMAGLPMARIPAKMMDPKASQADKAMYRAFKKMVGNIRRDEHDGIVLPSNVDPDTKTPQYNFELLTSGGARTFDTNGIIQRLETNILTTVMADFIKLGSTATGSYAMHVDKTGIFRAALNTITEGIADVLNRHAIPRLFAMNQWKLDELPKFEPTNVDPPDLNQLSSFMSSMSGLGMTFFPDPDLEKFLRETAHLPPLSEDVEELRRAQADQANAVEYMRNQIQDPAEQAQMEIDQEKATAEGELVNAQAGAAQAVGNAKQALDPPKPAATAAGRAGAPPKKAPVKKSILDVYRQRGPQA